MVLVPRAIFRFLFRFVSFQRPDGGLEVCMRILGNVLWFLFGGFLSGLGWVISGVFWCVSLVGIPYGIQCFKFAGLAFFPFGKEIEYGGGAVSFLANVIWTIFFGIPMAAGNFICGCLWCVTIIGIPFGKQCFKIAKLSLAPFGSQVVSKQNVR